MSKKQPPEIKNDIVLSKAWSSIHNNNGHAVFLVTGEPNAGKSVSSVALAEKFDPNFTINQVVTSTKEYLQLDNSNEIKRGSAIVFDEFAGSEKGADSRSSMSSSNKIASYITTTFRQRGYLVFYISPYLSQIDANVRKVGVMGRFNYLKYDSAKHRAIADFFWQFGNPGSTKQRTYRTRPRIHIKGKKYKVQKYYVGPPTRKIYHQYMELKESFLDENTERWLEKMKEKDLTRQEKEVKKTQRKRERRKKQKIKLLKEAKEKITDLVYKRKGDPQTKTGLLKFHLNLSTSKARELKDVLNQKIKKGEIKVFNKD